MDFRRCCHRLPWMSAGFHGATAHSTSTANATVVATALAALLSAANSVVPTMAMHVRDQCHGIGNCRGSFHGYPRSLQRQSSDRRQSPRKSAAIATAVSSDVEQFTRPSAAVELSTAIATAIIRWAATPTEICGNPRQWPRQFPKASNRIKLPRHPGPCAIVTELIRCAANTTAVPENPRQ